MRTMGAMSSKACGPGATRRRGLLGVSAPLVLLMCAIGCSKTSAQDSAPEAGAVPAASAEPDTSAEVTPPPPVVAGDPDVPLNEAVVGAAPVPDQVSVALTVNAVSPP